MKEIWKDVVDYEGKYEISNYGRVRNKQTNHIMTPNSNTRGYLLVGLTQNNKTKNVRVHRLVAEAFIPNPNNLPQINHIKEDEKTNNCVENLEWCNCKYNCNYGTRNKKVGKKQEQAVKQIDKNTNEVISIFKNALEAAKEINVNVENIHRCCKNKTGTSGGFKWQYV